MADTEVKFARKAAKEKGGAMNPKIGNPKIKNQEPGSYGQQGGYWFLEFGSWALRFGDSVAAGVAAPERVAAPEPVAARARIQLLRSVGRAAAGLPPSQPGLVDGLNVAFVEGLDVGGSDLPDGFSLRARNGRASAVVGLS